MHYGVPAHLLQAAMGRNLDAAKESEKNDFLESLRERVGPDRGGGGDGWKEEAALVIKEHLEHSKPKSMEGPNSEEQTVAGSSSFEDHCSKYQQEIDAVAHDADSPLNHEDAQLDHFCTTYDRVLAAAVHGARTDYSTLLHRSYNLLVRLATDAAPAVDCYRHLRSTKGGGAIEGLQDIEPRWGTFVAQAIAAAEKRSSSDSTSCQLAHMTASGTTAVAPAETRLLAPEGFRQPDGDYSALSNAEYIEDSVIVKFVSSERDSAGLHTAVHTDSDNCVFPPMTLFTALTVDAGSFEYDGTQDLIRKCKGYFSAAPAPSVNGDGRLGIQRQRLIEWMVQNSSPQQPEHYLLSKDHPAYQRVSDWFHMAWLPPGVDSTVYVVHRTLITVQATYLTPPVVACASSVPAEARAAWSPARSSARDKLTANSSDLGYGDRMSYVRGVGEIVFARPLTMAEEWARNHEWADWTGGTFSGQEEFSYVWSQRAVEGRGGNPNFDKGHDGMVLADFRQLFVDLVEAANGGDGLVPTLEEVAAARLYTGTC